MKFKRYYLRISRKLGRRMGNADDTYRCIDISSYATNCNIPPHHYRFLFSEFPIVRQSTESPKVSFVLIRGSAVYKLEIKVGSNYEHTFCELRNAFNNLA